MYPAWTAPPTHHSSCPGYPAAVQRERERETECVCVCVCVCPLGCSRTDGVEGPIRGEEVCCLRPPPPPPDAPHPHPPGVAGWLSWRAQGASGPRGPRCASAGLTLWRCGAGGGGNGTGRPPRNSPSRRPQRWREGERLPGVEGRTAVGRPRDTAPPPPRRRWDVSPPPPAAGCGGPPATAPLQAQVSSTGSVVGSEGAGAGVSVGASGCSPAKNPWICRSFCLARMAFWMSWFCRSRSSKTLESTELHEASKSAIARL